MQKTILIVTDNLPEQINGVVTTYKNIETYAIRDGYRFVYITPNEFSYIDCPIYNEVKIAYPRKMGQKIEAIALYVEVETTSSSVIFRIRIAFEISSCFSLYSH